MADREMRNKLHSTPTEANPKRKKRGIFSSTSKKDNLPATTQLMFPKDVQPQSSYPQKLHFKTEDKISVLFKYKNYCVVQRKHDRTVAVLKNPVFKERNPPLLFDGTKLETALYGNISIVLMYSLAKTNYNGPEGIEFEKDDVIFTLAACGKELLGISQSYKVGFFPSDLVLPITKRRLCFYEGMMLQVTAFENYEVAAPNELSLRRGQDYEINKGKKGLFDWYSSNNLRVPLNFVAEKGINLPAMTDDDRIYETIPEIKQPLSPLSNPLYDRIVPVLNSDRNDGNDNPSGKCTVNKSGKNQSTTGAIDLCKHPDEFNKEIEKQFRECLALDRRKQASDVLYLPPLPSPRCNHIYMDSNTSSFENQGYVTTAMKFSEVSDADYDTLKIGCGTVDHERKHYIGGPDGHGTALASTEQTESKNKTSDVLPLSPLPSPRCNSIYMDSNTSSVISDADYDTVKIDCGTVDHERKPYEGIPNGHWTAHAPTEQTESKSKNKPYDKLQDLLNNLACYRDVKINEQIRCIVSKYVDEDVWDQLGRRVKVPKNKRREIESKEGTIYDKTNELLSIWCERFGSDATLGFLLDALVQVNPEDLDLILEDVCKAFSDRDGALYGL